MQATHASAFITPTQGFVGGIGIALACSLLLFSTGKILGISGILHRSLRPSPTSSLNSRRGDIVSVVGLLLGGLCIGALQLRYPEIGGYYGDKAEPLGGTWTYKELATVALAGFSIGIGSKLQNGCTSGHMVCGVSRFSRRSLVASLVFSLVACVTAQFHRQTLRPLDGFDWSLGTIGPTLLEILAALFMVAFLILAIWSRWNASAKLKGFNDIFEGLITLLSTITFALALRLSTLNSPTKVLSFLVTPFPDASVFDPTIAFLSLGVLPLAALLYYLGNRLHVGSKPRAERDAGSKSNITTSEREPLVTQEQTQSPGRHLPVFDTNTWPDSSYTTVDARLLTGAVLFGIGWGTLGVCPGPAVVNFGISLSTLLHGELEPGLVKYGGWLAAFAVGGLVV